MPQTAQATLDELTRWFPAADKWHRQTDTGTPATNEVSARQSLGLSSSGSLSQDLQNLADQTNAHFSKTQALQSSLQAVLNANTNGYLFSGNGNLQAHLNDLTYNWYSNWIETYSAEDTIFYVGADYDTEHITSTIPYTSGEAEFRMLNKNAWDSYMWPNVLFKGNQYDSIQSVGMAFLYALETVQDTLGTALGQNQFDATAGPNAVSALTNAVANLEALRVQLDSANTLATRVEVEEVAGFVALGVGAVIMGAGFLEGTAGLAAEIAALAAEEFGAFSEGVISRSAAQGLAESQLALLEDIQEKIGSSGTDVATTLRQHTELPIQTGQTVAQKVNDFLSQTSILVNGQEVMLLQHLYITNGTENILLSDALKGSVYADTSGVNRNAIRTETGTEYRIDMQEPGFLV